MTATLVLTVIGEDRPGLVESLSHVIAEHGGNWLDSRMARLAGKFAGILRVNVPAEHSEAIARAFQELSARGLRVVAESSGGDEGVARTRQLKLDLVGDDRPGIVSAISRALARRGINVEELETEVVSAPMSGDSLFKATALLSAPPNLAVEDLRQELEDLANDLVVDISLAVDD